MKWSDFIQEPETQRVSASRTWMSVGFAVSTWVMVYLTLHDRMTGEILLAYLAALGGVEVAKRGLTRHYSTSIEREKIRVNKVDNPDA